MSTIAGEMKRTPLIQPSKVDISNEALHFHTIHKSLQLLKVSNFSRPKKLLVALLLLFPPVAPCAVHHSLPAWLFAHLTITKLASAWHDLAVFDLSGVVGESVDLLVISYIIHFAGIFINNHKWPFFLVYLAHVKSCVFFFVVKELCEIVVTVR